MDVSEIAPLPAAEMKRQVERWVEAIGRNSNLAHLSNKWSDLRERVSASSPRSPLLYQDNPKSRTKRVLSATETTDITTRYKAGETTQHIATHYGISKTRVATILRDHNITIRRQGLTTKQVAEAAALYATGRSLAEIGARFSVSHTTVAAAFRRQGIGLRPRRGWS